MAFFLQACSTSSETHIKQSELLALLSSPEPVLPVIIDVRSSMEYTNGHIPHAQHIPFWQSFTTDALEKKGKQEELILYCEHGPRAGIAKFAYYMAGYKNIRYVEGHMTAWRSADLPIDK